jgi:Xaa-Pro dipeptidase
MAWELRDYSLRAEPLVEQLRLVKSPTEIEMIRRAAHYADLAVEQLLSASYYGATVAEGFARTRAVSTRIIREVQDWDPLTSRVLMATWAAPHSAMPHSIPSLADRLREGPHTALVLTRVNGYSSESERTYFTAVPSSEARQAFAAMMEARQRAFELVRPGVAAADIDGAVNDFLSREGFSGEDRRLHRTGHGIGLGTHERPWIAEGSNDRLSENMVISIEPGVYLPGIGGCRHSDTVRVTSTGAERLTSSPDALDDLTLSGLRLFARAPALWLRPALRLREKSPSAPADSNIVHHAR